jgi:hypothetical protein
MESARKKDHNGCGLAFPLAPCDAESGRSPDRQAKVSSFAADDHNQVNHLFRPARIPILALPTTAPGRPGT